MKDPQTTTSGSIIDTAPTRTTTSAIQPLEEGFRILHVMHSASAQHEFKVGFHSSGTIEPVRFEDGSLVLHAPDGTYLGDIEPPWAIDANGSPVPTRYRWEHGTLIQVVDHDPRHHRYPIVIDPKWTYGYNLTAIGAAGYPTLGVNTAMAMRELRRCFNCSFPIKGAPRSYPKTGQNINLNAWPLPGGTVVPAPIRVPGTTSTGFSFVARQGHFDGAGSTISFRFYHTCLANAPMLRLSVKATITKHRPFLERQVIRATTYTTWSRFVSATADNAGIKQGYHGKC